MNYGRIQALLESIGDLVKLRQHSISLLMKRTPTSIDGFDELLAKSCEIILELDYDL